MRMGWQETHRLGGNPTGTEAEPTGLKQKWMLTIPTGMETNTVTIPQKWTCLGGSGDWDTVRTDRTPWTVCRRSQSSIPRSAGRFRVRIWFPRWPLQLSYMLRPRLSKVAWWPWPLTLKVVSESRKMWAISVPILVFLGLSVIDLGPTYTLHDRQKHCLMPPPIRCDGIINRYNVTQYPLLPRSLPIRPTRPASRVTRSCLHTSRVDEFTWEEGSAAYTHTCLINKSCTALTNFPSPHPCGLMHWASLRGRPQHWRMKGRRHASLQIVNHEPCEPIGMEKVIPEKWCFCCNAATTAPSVAKKTSATSFDSHSHDNHLWHTVIISNTFCIDTNAECLYACVFMSE